MAALLALLLVTADGGTVSTDYRGTLEAGRSYVLIGEHDPERGVDLFAQLRPPTLKLPMHHASRVEWTQDAGALPLPTGQIRVEFVVESVDIARMTERRWNSTYRCRLVRAVRQP